MLLRFPAQRDSYLPRIVLPRHVKTRRRACNQEIFVCESRRVGISLSRDLAEWGNEVPRICGITNRKRVDFTDPQNDIPTTVLNSFVLELWEVCSIIILDITHVPCFKGEGSHLHIHRFVELLCSKGDPGT